MNFPRLRLWIAAVVLVLAVGLLLASVWPLPRKRLVIPMPPVNFAAPGDTGYITGSW